MGLFNGIIKCVNAYISRFRFCSLRKLMFIRSIIARNGHCFPGSCGKSVQTGCASVHSGRKSVETPCADEDAGGRIVQTAGLCGLSVCGVLRNAGGFQLRLNCAGDMPFFFWNARLNVDSELKPDCSAICSCVSLFSLSASSFSACSSRLLFIMS